MSPASKLSVLLVVALLAGAVAFALLDAGSSAAPGAGRSTAAAPPAAAPGSSLSAETGDEARVARAPSSGREEVADGEPPTTARAVVAGRLVQADGEPAVGVKLALRGVGTGWPAGVELPPPATHVGTMDAVTDGDGRFRFQAPTSAGFVELRDDRWVWQSGRGLVAVPAGDEPRDLGELRVVAAATLAGTVQDAGGPVAGVEVGLVEGGAAALPLLPRRKETTDEQGRFTFAGLSAGAWQLRTASPRHLTQTVAVDLAVGESRDDVIIEVHPGGVVAGTVIDDLGRPIEDATVGAYRTRTIGGTVTVQGFEPGESVETDALGRFELACLGNEPVGLRAHAEHHQTTVRDGVQPGSRDVTLMLSRQGIVEGIVVDTSGAPMVGSRVHVGTPAGPGFIDRDEVRTDAEGRFRLANVAPGSMVLRAEGDHLDGQAEVTVAAGGTTRDVRIVVRRGATLAVTVVDPDGEPVEGASVEVSSPPAPQPPGMRRIVARARGAAGDVVFDGGADRLGRAKTGADGVARVGGLPPGPAIVVANDEERAPSREANVTIPGGGTMELSLALRRGGAVAIEVVDANGDPVADATVEVTPVGEAAGDGERVAKTAADGTTTLSGLVPGGYSAVLRDSARPQRLRGGMAFTVLGGGTRLDGTRTPFEVREGETARVRLTRPPMTTVIGTLSDASGPVAGGTVDLELAHDPTARLPLTGGFGAETDAVGTFRIENVPAGRYLLRYRRSDQLVAAEEPLDLHGEPEVERHLVLRGGAIRLRVADGAGMPVAHAKVSIQRHGADAAPRSRAISIMRLAGEDGETTMEIHGGPPIVETDDDGVALLRDVPAGRYDLEIEHRAYQSQRLEDLVVAAQSELAAGPVHLVAGALVHGSVQSRGGEPPMIADVEVQPIEPAGETRREVAVRGSFQLEGLTPGRYQLRAKSQGNGWGPFEQIEVAAGDERQVTLTLPD